MNTQVAVCGEALLDVFVRRGADGMLQSEACEGGSPYNVAIGLARLGVHTAFLGAISRDGLGEQLARRLVDEDVDTSHVQRLDARSTVSMVTLDERGVPSYGFYGDGAADRQWTWDERTPVPRAVHFGSFSMVVQPCGAQLATFAAHCRERGAFVSYDPNVRLNVEPDVRVWRDAIERMMAIANLVKVSAEDIAAVFPGEDAVAVARRWSRSHPDMLVVLTQGEAGLVAMREDEFVEAQATSCEVIDTVGAGDTITAALLAWVAEHGGIEATQLRDALHFASCAASHTCSRRGADMPRRQDLSLRA